MIDNFVILVDKNDKKIGLMSKMEAHKKGVLHRAFSVFIFNNKNELMLQKRNKNKYHSPGLWTNTCCSHQRDKESNTSAGKRRLLDEMGFCVELNEIGSFIYNIGFDNGLIEHELDYILVGKYNGNVKINPDEVDEWKWLSLDNIKDGIKIRPDNYTEWFKIIINDYYDQLKNFK